MAVDTFRTRQGRAFVVVGDPHLLTLDRLEAIRDRLDADPRIASVSLVLTPRAHGFLRSTAPAGCAIAITEDAMALAGPISDDITQWARLASEHGLWHDWLLADGQDLVRAAILAPMGEMDRLESTEASSSHFGVDLETQGETRGRGLIEESTITMVVDITWLGAEQTGAQVLTTAALEALARSGRVSRLTLIGQSTLPSYAAHLGDLDPIELIPVRLNPGERNPTGNAADSGSLADIIWYPNQIDQRTSIAQARDLGRRVITTYLDLIAYDIPRYHATVAAWAAYRSMQRKIALSVDGVTTISADVAERLCTEVPMLDRSRVAAIPLGLDHLKHSDVQPTPDPGDGSELAALAASGRRFLLVLGNDFRHKNRDFAIRVWEQVTMAGEACDLVLAGLHVKGSSSRDAERAVLSTIRPAQQSVITVGHVSERTRAWLLAHAAVVLYPTSAEGFGFIPYEAAALGTPTTFTAFGPLAEISGVSDVPASWTLQAYVDDVLALLRDERRRQARIANLQDAVARHTWDTFAAELLDFCQVISAMPPAVAPSAAAGSAEAAALAAVLSSRTWRATEPLRTVGRRLRRLRQR